MKYLNYKELGIRNNLDLIMFILGLIFCSFLFYVNSYSTLQPHANRGLILGAAIVIVLLKFPFSKTNPKVRWAVDGALITLTVVSYGYIVLTADQLVYRIGFPTIPDLLVYLPGTILCLEATRRATGPAFAVVGTAFVAYAHFGHLVPGYFSHRPFDFSRVADAIFLGIDGLFGPTTHVMNSMIWYFLVFGTFLAVSGAGNAFMDFAFALTGRRQGGPAQAAVVSSCLFGSVSGSGVANVATTGTFTIPLMKRVGYEPYFAGSVEAAASMGGQITPPVMGGTAFLISGITGIAYINICKAAVIPTFFYFFCLFMCVYFKAGQLGLRGLPREQVPPLDTDLLIRAIIPLSSILVIVAVLVMGFTPRMAALVAVLWMIILAAVYRGTSMNIAVVLRGLSEGFRVGAGLASILATAGVCVGVITITGIGMKFSALVVLIGQQHLLFAVVFIMLASLFLGMGLPTPAAYLILAILAGPAMIRLGAPELTSHLLIFYFAVFAGLTPPVGIAYMTAAGIAGAPTMKTGLSSFRLAFVGLVMPYLWLFKPGINLQGPVASILWTFFVTVIGVTGLSMALIGYWKRRLHIANRALLFFSSFALLFLSFQYQIVLVPSVIILMLHNKFGFSILKGKLVPVDSSPRT
ncbi:MAG: TRAP transporter fused permease subunit [Desulfobacteraceae bacterium]|nr:MAG: TRAP transporter fused permease subunit [Desulfobacteraceae bacterium]